MVFIGFQLLTKRYKNSSYLSLFLLFFILFLISPLLANEPVETVNMQLKGFHKFQFAGYYAAIEKGFYAEEGINVRLKESGPIKSSIHTVIGREADYGIADASLLLHRMRGKPVILLKQIFQHSPLVLITSGGSNIISPYEMKGKKVMFDSREDVSLLALFWETIGGTEKIRQIPHSYDYNDLIRGRVDVFAGYLTDAPYIYKQLGFPINVINPQNYGIDFYGDNLFTTEHEVKNHPERVEKIIRASIKGWEYALDHPREIIDLIRTKYNKKLSREQLAFEARMAERMIIRELIPVGHINPRRYERIGEICKRLGMTDDQKIPEGFIYQKNAYSLSVPLTVDEIDWINKHRKIIFGVPDKIEPYLIVKADGTYSGIIVDFLDELNKRLKTDFFIEAGPWSEIVEKTKNVKIDGLLDIESESADRLGLLKSMAFFSLSPVVYTMDDANFKGLDDLKNKVVAIGKGSYFAEEILKPYRGSVSIIRASDNLEAMQMVFENKADAMIGLSSDNYLISKYHLNGIIPSQFMWKHPLNAVIGVRSDWPELVHILNKGIGSFEEDELTGLVTKWYNMPIDPRGIKLTGEEKAFLLKNPVIRVAVDPHRAPIEYIDSSGNPLGISVDFLKRIGSALDLNFRFVSGDRQDLLNKLDNGEVDLFPSLSRTEKREGKLEYTSPYMNFPVMVFSKNKMPYVADLTELSNRKVSVVKGHAVDDWLTKDYPEIDLLRTKNIQSAIEALQSGNADACIGDILTVSNQISRLGYLNLNIVGKTPYSYNLRFAVRRQMAPLVSIIQKVLDSMTEPEKNAIRRKWISIGYERAFDYTWIWKGTAASVIILLLILLWNRYLALEVNKRTQALELNKRIVSNSSIGTVAYRFSGGCISANEAAAALVGETVETLLGQDFHKIKIWQETGLLDLAEKALESDKEQMGDITATTASGKTVSLHCRFIPFQFKNEQHLMLMYEDISERKKAEEAIRENERKYRTLFNSASDAIFLMEGDRFIDCNNRTLEMFGCTRDQIIGKPPYKFSPDRQPDGRSSEESATEKINAASHGKPQFFEWLHCRYDGSLFNTEVSLALVEISGNKYTLAIVRDITERKRAEVAEEEKEKLTRQLQQAQKMEAIGTLAGGIAHDFNNILSSIFGFTELAKMRLAKGENINNDLDEVLKAGLRAKKLVQHILTFSLQSSIQKSPVRICPLIEETLKFIRSSIPTTIEINYDLGDIDPRVLADPTQIQQILMNLCTNAAYAMKEKGGILDVGIKEVEIADEISLQYKELKPGKYVRLTVTDTGTGIEKSVIDRVFDPFFTTKERGEGTGLGLSIIHGIVKDMEGALSVYSEPGIGTTFHVLLPEYEGELKDTVSKGPPVVKGRGRILFIDDEQVIVDSGERILKEMGYDVLSTTSSIHALELFKSQPGGFDLVLTDMAMPKMTGLELSREILKIRPDIPIILSTGYSVGLTESMIRKIGISEMIMKPMISSELAAAINKALNGAC